jgi:SAM-dependent methyltransferase
MTAEPVWRQFRELLACPSCRGEFLETPEGIICSLCGRTYPDHDGVPNLLPGPPVEADPRRPGLAGLALGPIEGIPFIDDLIQRLAGARRISRRIRPLLAEADGTLVLDSGAGTGNFEALLPRSARYLWLDTDSRKLARFRRKSRAPAILGDATRLPLRDRSVDWALAVGMSHHLSDDELGRMLDELRRVVRERLFFLDAVVTPAVTSRLLWRYDRGRHPRTADLLRKQLATRFNIVRDEEFTVLHRYLLVTGT